MKWKRLGAVMLAAALMASALQPMNAALAAEEESTANVETTAAEETKETSAANETKEALPETTDAESEETDSTEEETKSAETKAQETETSIEETADTEETSEETEASEESAADEAVNEYAESEKTYQIRLDFYRWNEEGVQEPEETYNVETKRTFTLKSLGIKLPEMKPGYKGVQQIGWVDRDGNPVTEETELELTIYANVGNPAEECRTIYAVYATELCNVSYEYVNVNGEIETLNRTIAISPDYTYAEVKALVEKEAAPGNIDPKLQFKNWKVEFEVDGDADDKISGDKFGRVNVKVTAVYGQKYVMLEYVYINTKGQWVNHDTDSVVDQPPLKLEVNEEETYGEILKRIAENPPSDISAEYEIDHWERPGDNDKVPENGETIHVRAVYKGNVITVEKSYLRSDGSGVVHIPLIVEEGTTYGDLVRRLEKEAAPEDLYPGLRFKEWSVNKFSTGENIYPNEEVAKDTIYMGAVYENCIITYAVSKYWLPFYSDNGGVVMGRVIEKYFYQIAEKGETVSLMTEFEGYRNMKIYNLSDYNVSEDGTFVATDRILFRCYGLKASENSEDPENPANPEHRSQAHQRRR